MKLTRIFATIGLVACLTTPAFAQENELEFSPFLSAYFNTFYTSSTTETNGLSFDPVNSFLYNISPSSLFGAEMSYGDFSSVIALQFDNNFVDEASLTYNISDSEYISFGIIKTFAHYNNYTQVSEDWNGLVYYGALNSWEARPMIKWSGWGLSLAIIAGNGTPVSGQDDSVDFFENETTGIIPLNVGDFNSLEYFNSIPRFEVAYDLELDMFSAKVFGSYAPYLVTFETLQNTSGDVLLNTYSVGAGAQFNLSGFFIDLGGYLGSNLGLTDALDDGYTLPTMTAKVDTNGDTIGFDVENAVSIGAAASVGFAINDMFVPTVGLGFAHTSVADFNADSFAIYGNVYIYLTDWLLIAPEVAYTNVVETNVLTPTTGTGSLHFGFVTEFSF